MVHILYHIRISIRKGRGPDFMVLCSLRYLSDLGSHRARPSGYPAMAPLLMGVHNAFSPRPPMHLSWKDRSEGGVPKCTLGVGFTSVSSYRASLGL